MRPILLVVIAVLVLSPAAGAKVDNPETQPNIIVILADDQDASAETLSKMPYLSSRAGWYRFSNAFVNFPTCCPARATLLTGEWSHHHLVGEETVLDFDAGDTLATRLSAEGYRTGWFGKYHLGDLLPPGWDDFVDHDADAGGPYYDYVLRDNGAVVTHGSDPEDYSTDVLAERSVSFIDESGPGPFFMVFAPRAPHNNWTAAPRHLGTHADQPTPFPPSWNEDTSDKPTWWATRPQAKAQNRTGAMRKEWDTLLALDEAVEAIHKRVQDLDLMPNTVILYLSDNGYSFGEHRWGAKRCVYDSCTRTPLWVKFGGHSEGTVFDAMIGNEDIAPTLLELAGAAPFPAADGQSFYSMLQTQATPTWWDQEVLLRTANPVDEAGVPPDAWAVRDHDYLYAETTDTGETELYDLASDPFQIDNVASDPLYVLPRLEMQLRLAALRD